MMFFFALFLMLNTTFAQTAKPRVLYICSVCDQYQMASTEDQLTQAAQRAGVGVLKLGDVSEYTEYNHYKKANPGAQIGNLTPIKSVKLPYNSNTWPKNDKEASQRRQQFATAKAEWMDQITDQLKKLDKTKPLVLHMGNHGLNPGDDKKASEASFMCMYGSTAHTAGECISYAEFGQLMEKAGLTGDKAPPVRIVGDHCYGGGVHYLATKFANVCTASIVSAKTAQYSPGTTDFDGKISGTTGIDAFGATFWRNVKQKGSQANLADSYNSAWSTVPVGDEPGGTLSSIYYVQQVMGLSDKDLPTEQRLPALGQLERSFLEVDRLYYEGQYNYSKYKGIDSYRKPEYSCNMAAPSVMQQLVNLGKISNSLGLANSNNIYSQALVRAKDPKFMKSAQQNKAELEKCYKVAQNIYDKSTAEVKAYIEKSKWSAEFFWKFESSVDRTKAQFRRTKEREMAGKVLTDLKSCVEKKSVGVREYLNTITTLNRLEQLEAFSKKATTAQKAEFRKKVACESGSLF
jgi:hypothetical protein